MNRDKFLANIRQASIAGRAYRVHPEQVSEQAGYVGTEDDCCAAMVDEVNKVGGVGTLVEDLQGALTRLADIVSSHAVKSAVCWQHDLLDRLGLASFLDARGVRHSQYSAWSSWSTDQCRTTWLDADIGITSADLAIAETGTLLVASGPGHERVVSLLPPVHVAIVGRSQIVPDLIDATSWLQELGFENFPSNVTLISGPSKTGDIELQLTTGVHGPGNWYVIVIQQDES